MIVQSRLKTGQSGFPLFRKFNGMDDLLDRGCVATGCIFVPEPVKAHQVIILKFRHAGMDALA